MQEAIGVVKMTNGKICLIDLEGIPGENCLSTAISTAK